MTAAVPVPQTSSSVPRRAAAATSSIAICRSLTRRLHSRISASAESRVTPAKIVPPAGGVMTSPSIFSMMFIVPTSSMYLRSRPSSHSTCVKPSCLASSDA